MIGRRSENRPQNELVAVDLRSYPSGLRVSRRHVRLTEQNGVFFVENLSKSNNEVLLLSQDQAAPTPVAADPVPIAPGDVIRLERSDIELKLIVRATPAAWATATPDVAQGEPGEPGIGVAGPELVELGEGSPAREDADEEGQVA
jgi:pSer/pThr/pTyr-binding forkhead associated (FHA) protein